MTVGGWAHVADVLLFPVREFDGDAVPGMGVAGHFLHVLAEMDLLLTGLAEADAAIVGRIKIFPKLRALESELYRAVGDGSGGHGVAKDEG